MIEALTEPITWHPVAEGLPDADLTVLLYLAEDERACEGWCDGTDDDGMPLWRGVDSTPLDAFTVTHWADMPTGPIGMSENPMTEGQERADFEKWQTSIGRPAWMLHRREGGPAAGEYVDSRCEDEWEVWQARAALTTAHRTAAGIGRPIGEHE